MGEGGPFTVSPLPGPGVDYIGDGAGSTFRTLPDGRLAPCRDGVVYEEEAVTVGVGDRVTIRSCYAETQWFLNDHLICRKGPF